MPAFQYIYLTPVIPIAVMVVSDYKKRTVNIAWLIAAAVALLPVAFIVSGFRDAALNGIVNISVTLLLLSSATVYWRIRYGKWLNPVDNLFGLGDLVFISSFAFLFQPRTFLLLLLASMVAGLLWWMGIKIIRRENKTVPLVSCMGCVLILWLIKEAVGI